METREYQTVDKSQWERGEWTNEYDKKQFTDPETGFPCLVRRHPEAGHLCGYVGVSPGHPLYENSYTDCDVRCHGGVTFTDFCQSVDDEANGICHVVEPGDEERVWWIGFDCAHSGDRSPTTLYRQGSYRNTAYVERECGRLAAQLKAMQVFDPIALGC